MGVLIKKTCKIGIFHLRLKKTLKKNQERIPSHPNRGAGHQWDSWERHNLGRALLLSLLWPELCITRRDEHWNVKGEHYSWGWTLNLKGRALLLGMNIKTVRTVPYGAWLCIKPNIPFGDWHTGMLADEHFLLSGQCGHKKYLQYCVFYSYVCYVMCFHKYLICS